jgi:Zonular occludens toxin (Zot)
MGITAIIGQQGRGKSFYMIWLALNHAMKYCKRIVTNFPLNIEFFERFAVANNLKNLYKMIAAGDIIFIPGDVEYLLSIPDSCVLFDEAAIFLGDATHGQKVSYLISRFNQCRKRGIELFYTGQAFSRIPKILRDITTGVIYCNGTCTRDEWGKPLLYHAKFTFFEPDEFDDWFASSKKSNWLYTRNHSYRRHHFILNSYFALFFNIYDSFIDVIADTPAPGYKCLRIIPRGNKVVTTVVDSPPFQLKPHKLKSKKFHPVFVRFLKRLLIKRSYKTNDYISDKKWDVMIAQRPMFLPDDPFKLNWLEKKTPVLFYQSVSQFSEFPKEVQAYFVLAWRISHFLPAPLLPLVDFFYGLDFAVPVDSVWVKFAKMKT